MAVLKNRAKMSTSTTGTGTITLGSAESGYQTFADAGVANADVVRYVIEDGNNWEIGTGTYTATGTTLSRTVSESSNADAAINLSGSATVFIGATAEDIQNFVASTSTATAPNDSVSIAIGGQAVASGTNSISLQRANSSGTDSIAGAIANNTTSYGAHGLGSISIGTLSKATQIAGTAVGYGATSTHAASSAFGTSATTTATNQISLGGSGITARISGAYNLPTSDGTNGQVLTTDGAGAVTFADAGGGSLDLYAENYTSGTKPTATGTNAIAIGKGSSAAGTEAIAMVDGTADSQDSFAVGGIVQSAIGGYAIGKSAQVYSQYGLALGQSSLVSASSYGTAVGYQSVAGANSAVAFAKSRASGADSLAGAITNNTTSYGASGANSVAMGYLAKANNSYATVSGGASNVASGYHSTVIGGSSNLADNIGSTVLGGRYGTTRGIRGAAVFGGYGNQITATQGTSQSGLYILAEQTTDATATALKTDNQSSSSTANQIVLPNGGAYAFTGTIVGREAASSGTECAAWKVEGLIRREANAGSTVLVNSSTTVLNNAPSWGMALSADTTNGALAITVTGAAKTIRWVGTITTTELTFA